MVSLGKKVKTCVYFLIFSFFGVFFLSNQLFAGTVGPFWRDNIPLTKSGEKVLTTDKIEEKSNNGKESNIRKGMKDVLGDDSNYEHPGIQGVIKVGADDQDIKSHERARKSTMEKVSVVINYALTLLGVISLIFLLYHGFLVIVKGDVEEGKKGIKTACIALIGIGLSWFIVSFIFWLIGNLAPSDSAF